MVLPGFNTDFKYRGETYHAQTEDNGVNNPVVVTLLYFKGAILASKRTSYSDLLGRDTWQHDLMELMRAQHKDIMRDLLAGRLDRGDAAPRTAAAAAPSAPRETAPPPAPATPPASAPPPLSAAPPAGAPPREAAPRRAEPAPPAPPPRAPAPAAQAAPAATRPGRVPVTAAPPTAPPTLTLDAAIMRYLEEHAAQAAAAGH